MKELMTPDELSEYTGTPVHTLAHWRYVGRGPRFVKLGRAVRYRAEDVRAWLEAQTRQSTAETGPSRAA
ncbi:DNA binding domain, excisionase family [Micrococcus luteus SK58]|uniref:helix-turn-helix transcriptional regulator n=1 Tax=Micrococcus TaxID=1269 RepID=UPI0001C4FAC2|nr:MULTISPECIES: helix-turn-helix domain-containing protein [Micrococcus]EFD51811.1 DNA binding domain, excisionase family [Micrococcus luteus SK58]MCF8559951.1 helix-turn-helix domain-containing protein [Micrococcus yunnanensis]